MGCLGWGRGRGRGRGGLQPTGIRLSEAHMGREFDTLNVPRVGNLTTCYPGKWRTAERNLLFKFYDKKYFVPQSSSPLRSNTYTKPHFENMPSTYLFPPDATLPQDFDKTKDKKIIHKDIKDFWNSVLDLLVHSKCPIKWNLVPQVQNISC